MRLQALLLLLAATLHAGTAEKLFEQSKAASREGDYLQAYLLVQQARSLRPGTKRFARSADILRPRAAQSLAGLGEYRAALSLDPANPYLLALLTDRDQTIPVLPASEPERPKLAGPALLRPKGAPQDLDLRGKTKEVYEKLAERFGLDILFDDELREGSELRFRLSEANFAQAVIALSQATGTFIVPLSDSFFLVAQDTANKRREFEPVTALTVRLPNAASPEQIQEVTQALQQTLDIRRIQPVSSQQALVLRAPQTHVTIAQELLAGLSQPRGEVVFDLELLTTSATRDVSYGANLPAVFPLTYFGDALLNNPAEIPQGVALLALGGGNSLFGLTVGNATAFANESRSKARGRQQFSLRAQHGIKADLRIGERFPVITATFTATTNDTDNPNFIAPIPSFNFEDLGLILALTPQLHGSGEVTVEIDAEFKLLSGSGVNDIPIIANRKFTSTVRLAQGEAALLTGMRILEERQTRSSLWPFADIPLLKHLFADNTRQFNESDLILVIRPRIVTLPPADTAPSITLRHGPEQRPVPVI